MLRGLGQRQGWGLPREQISALLLLSGDVPRTQSLQQDATAENVSSVRAEWLLWALGPKVAFSLAKGEAWPRRYILEHMAKMCFIKESILTSARSQLGHQWGKHTLFLIPFLSRKNWYRVHPSFQEKPFHCLILNQHPLNCLSQDEKLEINHAA